MSETTQGSFLPGTERSGSLRRAFDLLRSLASFPQGASIAELSQASGLPRSTVTRLLASLFDVGAVARPAGGRKWVLGPAILELTEAVAPLSYLQSRGREALLEVREQLGETAMLAIPTGPASARVIEEVRGEKVLGVSSSWIGSTITSPASGFVRHLLAELPENSQEQAIENLDLTPHTPQTLVESGALLEALHRAKHSDCVIVIDEYEEGLAGISVPVRKGGRLIAMLAVYLPTSRFTSEFQELALEALRDATEKLV